MLRLINTAIIAIATLAMSACAFAPTGKDPTSQDPAGAPLNADRADDPSPVADDPAAPPEIESSPDVTIPPPAGCSVVQFCNAPGSEGTRCVQQGCTVKPAVTECKAEVPPICGTPVLPWIFVTSDGVHHPSTASCILSNRCGGQAPSGCFCDTACTSFGDCCFDGPC